MHKVYSAFKKESNHYLPEFTRPLSTPFFNSDNLKVGLAISTCNYNSDLL